ncbi:N-6 DNA methylase [Shewanella xiamenensis]|uniref:site-specific DNA-methyltransferase (adenine-specific) n=1 Tax=Shewanella xiamenensis TaxID=332186 RepID=A0ABT6U7D6_9GAMM|nr:N-6 DNA methylase [Shewanella xiamenensis]MDH1625015.1 SAM-dependent methyltransferase [Shewanella xiamenensis]MDI5829983.1 SAM-dependent methyltransferase [Shewanella xiamenensis]
MELSQYYTPTSFSSILIANMLTIDADSVLDIGCGQASLLEAARHRWSTAKLIGYDIDPTNYSLKGKNLHIGFGDGLDPDLSSKILDTFGNIDISVANPPYTSVDMNRGIVRILKQACLFDCLPRNIKKIPSEIVFLAQNFLVLKDCGELGAILPASIISGEKWKHLREYLITEKRIGKVIQLPKKAFSNTEAATFAVVLDNRKSNSDSIELSSIDSKTSLKIDNVRCIKRLDYCYHSNGLNMHISKVNDGLIIFRGNKSSKEITSSSEPFIHTSDLKNIFQILSFEKRNYPKGAKVAKKGDFVVSRVGSRCIGKAAYINEGEVEVSDCITVLSGLDKELYIPFFKFGKFYENALSNALGTGAQYLTFEIIREALGMYDF